MSISTLLASSVRLVCIVEAASGVPQAYYGPKEACFLYNCPFHRLYVALERF